MAYGKDGYPTELANKVGHVKLIQDPMIQRMIEAFQDVRQGAPPTAPPPSGHVDIHGACPIDQVVTIDGGHQAVPNIARPERQVGFIQVAAQLLRIDTINTLRGNPLIDPREVRRLLGRYTHHTLATLPLSGIHIPGMTVRESVREAIHRFLAHYELYDALAYLVYRAWQSDLEEPPSMNCISCSALLVLPRHARAFRCSHCGFDHRLADYLGLQDDNAEDRSRAETVSGLRAVIEVLVLFSFVIKFREQAPIMRRTLFLLDGPLILRAQLSRLVEPLRALIADQRIRGLPLNLVGVEKTGEVCEFAATYAERLMDEGDYFLPTTRFVVEDIHGHAFNQTTYRNRVNYGAKAIVRVGKDHVLALNVPTGDYVLDPQLTDLIGFDEIVRCLSRLRSYAHPNALIPIVLANTEASISNKPSGGLLAQFVDQLLRDA